MITQPRQFSIRRHLILTAQKTGFLLPNMDTQLRLEKWRSRCYPFFTTNKEIIVSVTLVRSREAQHLIKE